MYADDDRNKIVVVAEGAEDWSDDVDSWSAFTVAELGEMLPEEINKPLSSGRVRAANHWLSFGKYYGRHRCSYIAGKHTSGLNEWADTEADARAKMLIYLIENKLVTV
jgi:hypothetical protein